MTSIPQLSEILSKTRSLLEIFFSGNVRMNMMNKIWSQVSYWESFEVVKDKWKSLKMQLDQIQIELMSKTEFK
jgi:hypothetical protein